MVDLLVVQLLMLFLSMEIFVVYLGSIIVRNMYLIEFVEQESDMGYLIGVEYDID